MVKNLPVIARDLGLIPDLGRFPEEGNGNPLQFSCQGNPMDRGAWWVAVHEVSKKVGHDLVTKQQWKVADPSLLSPSSLIQVARISLEGTCTLPCGYLLWLLPEDRSWPARLLEPVGLVLGDPEAHPYSYTPWPSLESESRSLVSNSLQSHGLYTGHNTGVGNLSLLQGIFPTQGLNPGLTHCRRILHQLSHHSCCNKVNLTLETILNLSLPGLSLWMKIIFRLLLS